MLLAWLDLETTGLDEMKNSILEVAVCTAELEDPFNILSRYQRVLHYPVSNVCHLDPFIIAMHTKNGLFKECAESNVNVASVEHELLKIIPDVVDKNERTVLAGSSVHFDHKFIAAAMPTLNQRLSHRHYDVSALKLECQSQGMPKFRKAEAHRALDDIMESIAHAKECREWQKKNILSCYRQANVHTH